LARLMDLVYPELHRIAARHLRSERRGHTFQPTALVNEAYLRLAKQPDQGWQDRAHFFAVAARIVRRILVDHARARLTVKRGEGGIAIELTGSAAAVMPQDVDVLDLDDALSALEVLDRQQSQVVELRYFAGLSIDETAEVLRVSPSSVKRDWVVAKSWLRRRMLGGEAPSGV
jgi:RNA polymerase sigma factor (TIGR02999 family)